MAGANGTALIESEKRFARLFAERHSLEPPVPVEDVLRGFAKIEIDNLPGSADAIVLRKTGSRPLVVVSTRIASNRRRFTLAHELGHIVLPWQVGSAFCHPQVTYIARDDFHVELEAQANRFATELLVPERWLAGKLGNHRDKLAERIVQIANEAQVSPITASIALGSVYAFQAATCITDSTGKKYLARSETCLLRREHAWWSDPESVEAIGGEVTRKQLGTFTLHAVTFGSPGSAWVGAPAQDSKAILKQIAESLPVSQREHLLKQVSGVVGAANNYQEGHSSAEALLRVLYQRFLGHQELKSISQHPLFANFLSAKAHELHERRVNKVSGRI
ncbi:MAG: ImmA/IrrE family metallo-endopeptidase [Polyangiaceae bacterium]|nr:ImmA/IrrE family metallo-endopeptidase [Polyangiaceae bacterium]